MGNGLTPRQIVLNYLDAFSSGNPEAIAAWVSEDFENVHTSTLGESSSGRTEYLKRLPAFLAVFAGLSYEPQEVLSEGERVAVAYKLKANNLGVDIEIDGMMLLTVAGDRIIRRVDYWDGLSYLHQTGQR